MDPNQKRKTSTGEPTDKPTPKPRRTYGGRRAKPDAERKETVVKVYLDERQDTQLRGQHREYNSFYGRLSLSEFIKKCCHLDGPVPKTQLTTTDIERQRQLIQDVRKLASHLGAICTNYNQFVKRIDSLPVPKKLIDEVEQFRPIHIQLAEHTDELKQLIVRLTEHICQLK